MSFHRNDIAIGIDKKGNVYAAQGPDACEQLRERAVEYEDGLYYSQLPHRVAWRDVWGEPVVSCPSKAPANVERVSFACMSGMTGQPRYVGQV